VRRDRYGPLDNGAKKDDGDEQHDESEAAARQLGNGALDDRANDAGSGEDHRKYRKHADNRIRLRATGDNGECDRETKRDGRKTLIQQDEASEFCDAMTVNVAQSSAKGKQRGRDRNHDMPNV
jgi:hypothetical protein